MIKNYKNFIKKLLIKTPLEMEFRKRLTNKKNYEHINLKDYNNFKLLDEGNHESISKDFQTRKNNFIEKEKLITILKPGPVHTVVI